MKIWYDNFKGGNFLCESFKLVSFNRFEKQAVKERHGRVGPVITDISSKSKKNNFLLYNPHR